MSEHRDREQTSMEDKHLTDTAKALIEVYKSAFGDQWQVAFISTVRLSLA